MSYKKALESVGGCKAFVSPLSSKLLSVGALLACYELREDGLKIGIPLLEAQSYTLAEPTQEMADLEMYEMWLAGECYDV